MAEGKETACLLDLPDHIIVENILTELIPCSLSGGEPNPKDLRDIFSFASTCTRIHALSSHSSLWRNVNATVLYERFEDACIRGAVPPPLPLGAVHCRVFVLRFRPFNFWVATFMEAFPDLTDVCVKSFMDNVGYESFGKVVRIVSSLPRLTRLELSGHAMLRAFADVKLSSSKTLESLTLRGNGGIVGFLFANSFPSLTSLYTTVVSGSNALFVAAVAQSCPALKEITLCDCVNGGCVALLANSCRSLRKITLCPSFDVDAGSTEPSATAPKIRSFSFEAQACRVTGGFLSLLPNLTKLRLRRSKETEDDLRAIGGMTSLERLSLDGAWFVDDSCRRLLPLVNHPKARERRSLKTLSLESFHGDLTAFLSSPWCSHLETLALKHCTVSGSTLESFTAAHGMTLSSTMRILAVRSTVVDGICLGRFVATLPSLEQLSVMFSPKRQADVNGFVREMGRGRSRLSRLRIDAPPNCERVDVVPLLDVISDATDIIFHGNFDQAAVASVRSTCNFLRRFVFDEIRVS